MFPQQQYMQWAVFFFKTPYFIIMHLTFITVTHYKMYVHLIHFRGLRIFTSYSLALGLCLWSVPGCTEQALLLPVSQTWGEFFRRGASASTVGHGSDAAGDRFCATCLKGHSSLLLCIFTDTSAISARRLRMLVRDMWKNLARFSTLAVHAGPRRVHWQNGSKSTPSSCHGGVADS